MALQTAQLDPSQFGLAPTVRSLQPDQWKGMACMLLAASLHLLCKPFTGESPGDPVAGVHSSGVFREHAEEGGRRSEGGPIGIPGDAFKLCGQMATHKSSHGRKEGRYTCSSRLGLIRWSVDVVIKARVIDRPDTHLFEAGSKSKPS